MAPLESVPTWNDSETSKQNWLVNWPTGFTTPVHVTSSTVTPMHLLFVKVCKQAYKGLLKKAHDRTVAVTKLLISYLVINATL